MHPVIAARLFSELRRICANAAERGVRQIQILLLGDILELLKSDTWLAGGATKTLKPWDRDRASELDLAVAAVTERIFHTNEEVFFAPLRKLLNEYPAALHYVYGNHDALLRTHGDTARAFLQSRFPELLFLAGGTWIDTDHETVAKHGHEWDPYNRVASDHVSPFGDAMVVEFITTLPVLVEAKQTWDLPFLDELDDVRPQTPKALAQWLDWNISRLHANQQAVRNHVNLALKQTAESLYTLPKDKFSQEAGFNKLQHAALRVGPALTIMANAVPEWIEEAPDYSRLAHSHLNASGCRFLLCGHTHLPEHQPISVSTSASGTPVYCNTGTWRRVHARVNRGGDFSHFHSMTEGCIVILWSLRERQDLRLPAYEFVRCSNGF
ncbi:MAG: hypothetical protein JST93_14280 [Acidobacteria bacterium]|nr:hypothetical protein [Acidobacteriota bacterium]